MRLQSPLKMHESENYYQVLGVSPTAGRDEIRRAYRYMARLTHPDVRRSSGSTMAFHRVLKAYSVLSDPRERLRYDSIMGLRQVGPSRRFYADSCSRLFADLFGGLRTVMAVTDDRFRHVTTGGRRRRAG